MSVFDRDVFGNAASSSLRTPGPTLLTVANATRIGTDVWDDAAGVITPEIAVPGAAPTTLAALPSFLLWDLGAMCGVDGPLTIADIAGVVLEMDTLTLPVGNGQRILLPFGLVFSASAIGSVAFATDASVWLPLQFGASSFAVTVASYGVNTNNASPSSNTSSEDNTVRMTFSAHTSQTGTTYGWTGTATQARAASTSLNGAQIGVAQTNRAATLNVYAFAGVGLGRNSGSAIAADAFSFRLRAAVSRRTAPS